MHILVTRPIEDAQETARLLEARGHTVTIAPLMTLRFVEGPAPDLAHIQALVFTSANGVRAFARRSPRRDIRVFAVGPQSAQTARQMGFASIDSGDGDARELARRIAGWTAPDQGALLHVTGSNGVARLADAQALHAFTVRREILYAMEEASSLPPDVLAGIGGVDAVLLYSPAAAHIFRRCVEGIVPTGSLVALCISPAACAPLAGLPLHRLVAAQTPNQDAMLALVAECQK